MNVRPDDMRKQVETWMTRVSAKEAICARYHLQSADVDPVLGSMGAFAWSQFVTTRDVNAACRQLEYRIEAGSTARPNKEWEVQTLSTAFTTMVPVLQGYSQMTGDMMPLNNLVADFAKSLDLDPARYQLRAMPMAPAAAPGQDPNAAGGHQSQATTNVPPPG